MDKDFTSKYSVTSTRTKVVLLVVTLVATAVLVGWLIGRPNKMNNNVQTSTPSNANGTDVASLVSYMLPDAWSQNICSASAGTIYVIPNGTLLDCGANPSAPIKIFIDSNNTTDCQQLKPATAQSVKKHVCISLYISGHKSLKASTEFPKSSSYAEDTTISEYYINTGKGVVVVEYEYTVSNDYQIGFDQLAKSIQVKN